MNLENGLYLKCIRYKACYHKFKSTNLYNNLHMSTQFIMSACKKGVCMNTAEVTHEILSAQNSYTQTEAL
jgi:hypothetical protein